MTGKRQETSTMDDLTSQIREVRERSAKLITLNQKLREDLYEAHHTVADTVRQRDKIYHMFLETSMRLADLRTQLLPSTSRSKAPLAALTTATTTTTTTPVVVHSSTTASSLRCLTPTTIPHYEHAVPAPPFQAISSSPTPWILPRHFPLGDDTPSTPSLCNAVALALKNDFQKALIAADVVLNSYDADRMCRLQARLVRAAVLVKAGQPGRAKNEVETTLKVLDTPAYVNRMGVPAVRGVANFVLARLLLEEGRVEEAAWAFSKTVGSEGLDDAEVVEWRGRLGEVREKAAIEAAEWVAMREMERKAVDGKGKKEEKVGCTPDDVWAWCGDQSSDVEDGGSVDDNVSGELPEMREGGEEDERS